VHGATTLSFEGNDRVVQALVVEGSDRTAPGLLIGLDDEPQVTELGHL
jgi:hypothetical protein